MKKSIRAIAVGISLAATFTAGVFAEDLYKEVTATLCTFVKVTYDGELLEFKDENGIVKAPLLYNGTVYFPSEHLLYISGKAGAFDSETNTISFTTPEPPPPPVIEPVISYEIVDNDCSVVSSSFGTVYLVGSVSVKNTGNTNLYMNTATFDIEDKDGKLIDSSRYISGYPQVLLPGETGVFYTESSSDKVNVKETYKIVPTVDVYETELEAIRCPVTDVSLTDSKWGGVDIVGRVENTTGVEQTSMNVAAVLFDKDGNVLDVERAYVNTMAPGAKMGFSTRTSSSLKFKAKDVASYIVYAYPYQYDWNY